MYKFKIPALIHPSRRDRMRIARQFIAGNDEPPTRTAGTNENSPAIHCVICMDYG